MRRDGDEDALAEIFERLLAGEDQSEPRSDLDVIGIAQLGPDFRDSAVVEVALEAAVGDVD